MPVVNPSNTGKTGQDVFIGREKQINEIIENVKNSKGMKLLLVGDSGIGKSALLDEIHRILTEQYDQTAKPFVGYYSKNESLIAESESLTYPFNIVLNKLVNNAKESQQLYEKIDYTIARVQRGLLHFVKKHGATMAVAIIQDLAKKMGLEKTLEVGKEIVRTIGEEKTSFMLAQQYIADHKDEARESYIEIFKAMADEFKDRRFVLIFDQFENVGKASIDFFLNFVKFLKPRDRFHIIICFRTDATTWNDPIARRVYEDLERKLDELGGRKMSIEGLALEDINKWIKKVRGISLPVTPDLQRIRENSAGFPLLLEGWIRSSIDLKDYDNIKRDKLCSQIIGLEKGLDEQDKVRLYMMSILLQPLRYKKLATYLEMDEKNIAIVRLFVKRLIEKRIFDERSKWFRHELIRKCFEDELDSDEKMGYYEKAAKFYEALEEEQKKNGDDKKRTKHAE